MGSPLVHDTLDEFASRLRRRFGERLHDVRPFGASLDDDADPSSGIEALVLVDDLTWNEKVEAIGIAADVAHELEVHLSTTVMRPEELARLLGHELTFADTVVREHAARPENVLAHVSAEIERGEQSLDAAEALVGRGLLKDAISRAYFAALHHAFALLILARAESRTHGGVAQLLSLHYVKPGKLTAERADDLARLAQFRGEADYNRFFMLTEEGAAAEVLVARRFCHDARALLEREGWSKA